MRLQTSLAKTGLSPEDLRWLASFDWRPDQVPAIESEAQEADYARRATAIASAVAHLSFSERGASPEGRLAAMIGARLADWRERGDDDQD